MLEQMLFRVLMVAFFILATSFFVTAESALASSNDGLRAQTITLVWSKTMPEQGSGRYTRNTFAPRIFFTDRNTLIWYQFEVKPKIISRRELPLAGETRYSLKVLTMKSENGNLVGDVQVATAARSAWLSDIPDPGTLFPAVGGLVLRTGGTIRFLSNDGKQVLKQIRWSDVRDDGIGTVSVKVSRNGKRIIADFTGKPIDIEREYDGKTFQFVGQGVPATEHHVQLNTGDWYWDRNFRSENIENKVEGHGPDLNKNEVMLGAQISTDNSMGAAVIATVKGEVKSLDIPGHYANSRAIVFDNEVGGVIGSIPFTCKRDDVYRIQLSPDGNWMALLNGRELSVYEIHR
jgi:hypothetical protein